MNVNSKAVRVNLALAVLVLLLLTAMATRAVTGDGAAAHPTDSVTTPSGAAPVQGERVPGDFDGDGQKDLAVVESVGNDIDERYQLRVLYGPFTSGGTPHRTGAALTSPISAAGLGYEDSPFSLTAGDADGDHATDIVATAHGDGEQEPSVLLHGGDGPGGFAARARYLRTGSSVAFGDFDGDGKGDIAVGDSGTRNGEPEADAQDPRVHDTVTVYYGGDRPAKRITSGVNGSYSTADRDHDGRDDLLISFEGGVKVLNGSADGLTAKEGGGGGGVNGWANGVGISVGIGAVAGSVLLAVRYRRRKASPAGQAP